MKFFRKWISYTLVAVFLASLYLSAASCKKKTSSAKKVSEGDPWYSARRVLLDAQIIKEDGAEIVPAGPWIVEDKYLMIYQIMTSYEDMELGVFDLDGNLLRMVDLEEIMNPEHAFAGYLPLGFTEGENGALFYFTGMMSRNLYSLEIDLETGLPLGSKSTMDLSTIPEFPDYLLEDMHLIEGYEVILYTHMYNRNSKLVVSKDGKALYDVDFSKAFGPDELKFVWDYFGGGNGTVIFRGAGKSQVTGRIDLSTGQVTKLTDAKPISDYQKISSTMDGRGYLIKSTGIYEYGAENGEDICTLNFDNCDINRWESQTASILYLDENKVILGSRMPPANRHDRNTPAVIYTLEKADKNPHVGKSVITVASLGDSLTYSEAEGLRLFNEQNTDYFAQLILYEQNDYLSTGDTTSDIDETDRQMYSAMSMVSGNLASDIRSGVGPDVVLGAAQSIDLLSSQYLMDMSSYLDGKSYDASAYYSNLIDAAKIDGKAYFIPTSFTIAGIIADGTKLPSDKNGFTYDEYLSYVSGSFNGVEPVTEKVSRIHFMNLCIQRNYAQWLKDGRMDFNQEGFRELAAFFKDSIPEGVSVASDSGEVWSESFGDLPLETPATYIENINSISAIAHYDFYRDNIRIVGLPSSDGSGLSASVTTSFSVTNGTNVKAGALALLDTMLSEEVQKETREAIPVNRAAARYKVEREEKDSMGTYTYYADALGLLYPIQDCLRMSCCIEPDSKIPEIFLQSLEEVDSIFLPDNSVMMIVSEEIPAYLLGQKDIDTVISTINNRSKTVFDER